ncbi:MAG: DUF4340 domain-containing protein [Ectothiorhodospiraceae bacterium]|nr:DUF4340 domain-containing protein [Ectothiorhodospiraceae bacterium]
MARRWWVTVLMLLLVGGLATVAWLEPGGGGDTVTLSRLDPGTVQELRIQRRNQESVVLRRDAHGWLLKAPAELRASSFHVEQVLALLRLPGETRYGEGEIEPAQVGLEPPRVRITVDGRELLLGASHPIGSRRYVRHDGAVYLVREGVMPLLEGPWWNFIDRRLVDPDRILQAVETPSYRLERDADGWRVSRGELPDGVDAKELGLGWTQASALVVRSVRREPEAVAPVVLHWRDGGVRYLRPEEDNGELRLTDPRRGLAYVLDGRVRAYLLGKD